FATDATFATGESTDIQRRSHQDHNKDGDTTDSGEIGNANFNALQAQSMPCYSAGTLIETDCGLRSVETLTVGDRVATRDHGYQAIRWIRAGTQFLKSVQKDQKPVLITAGALGPGLPGRALIVSPQHRILVGGCNQLLGVFDDEVFVPAKSLTQLPGIRHMQGRRQARWWHFACQGHELVRANGCLSESLLIGPMVLRQLPRNEQSRLRALFSYGDSHPATVLNGPPARRCLTLRQANEMCAIALRSNPMKRAA
ncbi:MAG: Hint domain-containing protein, partial [Pseudomonadota bacterium]